MATLELKFVLGDLANDYQLEPKDVKRIRAIVGRSIPDVEIDRRHESGEASVNDLVRQTLEAVIHYERLAGYPTLLIEYLPTDQPSRLQVGNATAGPSSTDAVGQEATSVHLSEVSGGPGGLVPEP